MKVVIKENSIVNEAIDIPLYFGNVYSEIQQYSNLIQIEGWKDDNLLFFSKGCLEDSTFASLPRSPFGGIIQSNSAQFNDFSNFIHKLKDLLKSKGVSTIVFNNPVRIIYPVFVTNELFKKVGFTQDYCELNQHVNLESIQTHEMQQRRYRKALSNGLSFRRVDFQNEYEKLYHFIEEARIQQGLKINIDQQRFSELVLHEDLGYEGWVVENKDFWMAALLTGRVDKSTIYYYLPASLKEHNSFSPMVFLLFNLYEILRSRGDKILDMGISSIKGKEQSSLALFKKRMGAEMHNRGSYSMRI